MKKSCTVEVQEWEDFLRLARLLSVDDWIFRGQQNAKWKLITAIERSKHDRDNFLTRVNYPVVNGAEKSLIGYLSICSEYPDELSAIKEFRHYAIRQGLNFGDQWIEYLAIMQHYGAPTRLLDFTTSIFVALYFARACEFPAQQMLFRVSA